MPNNGNDDQRTGNLSEEDWDLLITRIRGGLCTPFLGAGVNTGLLPLGATIAGEWADKHGFPLREKFDLARVSQYLALTKPDKLFPKELIQTMIQEKLRKQFTDGTLPDFTTPDHPLGVLAALDLPVYITTNYDDFMFRALKANRKNPQVELCAWNSHLRKKASVQYPDLSRYNPPVVPLGEFKFRKTILSSTYVPSQHLNDPIVYHLHGHYSSVDSMVLTENDYFDFLVNMSKDQKLLPNQISLALTNNSLLFIGYSLADPNFRVLFRGLIHPMGENRQLSVAIQLRPGDVPSPDTKRGSDEQDESDDLEQAKERVKFLEKYFDDLKIKVFWGSAEEFAAELWRRKNGD